METLCLLKKAHAPFIKLDHPRLLATAMSSVQLQQQQEQQQKLQQQQQQLCEESLSTAKVSTSATVIQNGSKDSERSVIHNCFQQQQPHQQQQQQQQQQNKEQQQQQLRQESENNNLKRAWNLTSSLTDIGQKTVHNACSDDRSNNTRHGGEPQSPPAKKICRDPSQCFLSGRGNDIYNQAGLNECSKSDASPRLFICSEKLPSEIQLLKMEDQDGKQPTAYPGALDYDHSPMSLEKSGNTNDTDWSESSHPHGCTSDYQSSVDKQDETPPGGDDPARRDADERVGHVDISHATTVDSCPATPSSGFIDIEADTPPSSPLNLTATTTASVSNGYTVSATAQSATVSAGCGGSSKDVENSNTYAVSVEDRHHDSAVSLEEEGPHAVPSAQQRTIYSPTALAKPYPVLEYPKHQTGNHKETCSGRKSDSPSEKLGDAVQRDFCTRGMQGLHKYSPQRPQQETLRTNFSIEAILSPEFGSLNSCTGPQPECNMTKPCSYLDNSVAAGSDSGHKEEERDTNPPVPIKSNHSAFTAVDLRMGTRSSSVCSPSPSSSSSVLSPPCSAGCLSPTLSSSSLFSAVPSMTSTDVCHQDSGNIMGARRNGVTNKNLHTPLQSNLNNLSDHKKLFLLGLYQLRHPHQAGLLTDQLYRGQDEAHCDKTRVHGADTSIYSLQKLFHNPTKDFDTFIDSHLPFLSASPLCHPTTLSYIYPPAHQQDHHNSHQHYHRPEQPLQKQQQHEQHNPHSLVFPNVGHLIAPPLSQQSRPHLDPLRLLQQNGYSAFLPAHSPPLTSSKSESQNQHLKKLHHVSSINPMSQQRHAPLGSVVNTLNTNEEATKRPDTAPNHTSIRKSSSGHTKTTAGEKTMAMPRLHPSNPLHDIIHQFDPEKLFSRTPLAPLLKLSPSRRGNGNSASRFSSSAYDTDGKTKPHGQTPGFDTVPFKHENPESISPNNAQTRLAGNQKDSYNCSEPDQKAAMLQEVLPAPNRTNSRETARAAAALPAKPKGDNSSTADGAAKAAAASEEKGTKGENPLWPAWVFCTRYSDRPSSGPRSRKPKRSKTQDEKRPRTAFTNDQLQRLKKEFEDCRYLTEVRRKSLADQLGLTESQIKIWFQNKRAKIKKSVGSRNSLAVQLMEQGLYNHSTVKASEGEDCD